MSPRSLSCVEDSIQSAFARAAGRFGGSVAVLCGDRQLTYAELDAQSGRLASYLRNHGVGRGDRVGLHAERSIDAICAMLGILKAGAAYVPFDPAYPAKLLEFVYEDCAPALMLIQSSLATRAPFWKAAPHDLGAALAASASLPELPPGDANAEDPAYVMYTSGSTGHPKGVLIPHRGVVRLVIDNPFAAMGADQVHLLLAPLAFDASTFEIWGALLNGGRLAVVPAPYPSLDDIASEIARYGVTTLWLTAGLFHLMVDHRLEGLKPLRQLLAGGDVLSPSHVARAQAALPACQLINGYGPTENTTFTCCYRIPRDGARGATPGGALPSIPIGTPIAHTDVFILDEHRNPVVEGQEGELYAGGAGVGLGYLNREELTRERFVANPFGSGGPTLYRTGDRVRRRPDGNIEFLGRVDRQVKINGKRVELDEIESILRRSDGVEDAAVTCPKTDSGPRRIHAYVKFLAGHAGSLAALRDHLRRESPDYMMPATFTVMDALPLSPTGKVERSKLPAPVSPPPAPAGRMAEGTDLERAIRGIWTQVLGSGEVGLNDNFFDLGGTSLQLLQVHATITTMLQLDLSVVDLFQYPKIGALAAHLSGRRESAPASTDGGTRTMNAAERAQRQQAALARARANPRRSAR